MNATVSENQVLVGCIRACYVLSIPVERRNVVAYRIEGRKVRCGRKGQADLTGTIPRGPNRGKRLEIEVKRPGERPRPEQLQWLADVRAWGGIAFWTDDPAECLAALRRVLDGALVATEDRG